MLFRQLFDTKSSTYTYLIASAKGREALIIDPVEENVNEYVMQGPNTFGNAFCKKCGSRAPRFSTARGWMMAPLGSTMENPEIEPTLVCAKDHTDWFKKLEEMI